MTSLRPAALASAVLALLLIGCGSAAPPSGTARSVSPSDPPATAAPPTQAAAAPADTPASVPGGATGSGSSSGSGSGGGIGGIGGGRLVVPRPGTIDPVPVKVEQLEARLEGRHLVVLAGWTSGVEPCYTLDSVEVEQQGNALTITLLEGSAERNAICIEIAESKTTAIDLGAVEPGSYRISASAGTAPPLTIDVP